MSNVISLHPANEIDFKPKLVNTQQVRAGLQKLWQMNLISTNAYAVGEQALYLLSKAKKAFIPMTQEEVSRRLLCNGTIVDTPPPLFTDTATFVTALAELHYRAGILNQTDKTFFNNVGNTRQHFSIPHPMRRSANITPTTKVFFRLEKMNIPEYSAHIENQWDELYQQCKVLSIIR